MKLVGVGKVIYQGEQKSNYLSFYYYYYYYYYLSKSVKSNLTPCIAKTKLNICSCLVSIVLKLY